MTPTKKNTRRKVVLSQWERDSAKFAQFLWKSKRFGYAFFSESIHKFAEKIYADGLVGRLTKIK